MTRNQLLGGALATTATLALLTAAIFLWQTARDEIYYLCGNFKPGVSVASVRQQLNTGEFLRYTEAYSDNGSIIEVNSRVTFDIYRCTIAFDTNGTVTNARFR